MPRRHIPLLVVPLLVLTGCAAAAGLDPASTTGPATHQAGQQTGQQTGKGRPAETVLATLPVKGRAPMTGYTREQFGQAWADVDHNGCDTRDDVLTRDLTDRSNERGDTCVVESGTIGDAWATGAFRWDAGKREALANDPFNLLAVDASANRQKGDGDAATWLPHNKGFRCDYVARQVGVKAKYGLWTTPAEHDAMQRVLDGCPGERVPTGSGQRVVVPARQPSRTEPFANCAAARAAGAAPVHRGDPGYGPRLDGDGDGVACE
jgi:hypothetical protein